MVCSCVQRYIIAVTKLLQCSVLSMSENLAMSAFDSPCRQTRGHLRLRLTEGKCAEISGTGLGSSLLKTVEF